MCSSETDVDATRDDSPDFPHTLPAPPAFGGQRLVRIASKGAGRSADRNPVYQTPSGERVSPSGMLFVQFKAGTRAESHKDDLARLGLSLVKVPSFAPHAAYVQGPDLASTLAAAEPLLAAPGVEGVEVQLARVAERKARPMP